MSVMCHLPLLLISLHYLWLHSNIPVKIYLHGKDQFLDLSGRMGYKFYPNMVEEAQVSYEVIQLFTRYSAIALVYILPQSAVKCFTAYNIQFLCFAMYSVPTTKATTVPTNPSTSA